MTKCHISYLVCAAALLGASLGAAPAATASAGLPAGPAQPGLAHAFHLVRPGQSIQQVVDAAKAGDTVLIAPGTYHESVKVMTPGLTLRGVGPRTVIEPAATTSTTSTTSATKKPAKNAKGSKGAKGTKDAKSCAAGGNGICVVGTKDKNVAGVTIADLTVTGFSRTGVFGMATDTMTVRNVNAVKNGVWGIAQERSVHGVFRHNTARENGDAGIFLANTIKEEAGATDAGQTIVEHNRVEDNRIGITVRRLRDLTVAHNTITGNCAGVFVVGDENKPKAGDLTVTGNRVTGNNKSCPKTDRLPALQGSGIVLTGTEKVLVSDNVVTGNAGSSPLSGGIVLFKSFVGATSDHNEISDNTLDSNSPADLVNGDTSGKNNAFEHNACRASKPSGLC
ncbi:right-handed parallel beta-helix repeat-containing protein [Streptomyces sp. NPDC047028]|uniref:right-handed parallel beta-helix repeat-containing protein n=1 Tax=Streptomyces sp. NPDC047028 TaxID=3155793 RepID=UPI0033CB3A7A